MAFWQADLYWQWRLEYVYTYLYLTAGLILHFASTALQARSLLKPDLLQCAQKQKTQLMEADLTKNLIAMRARSVPASAQILRHSSAACLTSGEAGCQEGGS